MEIPRFWRTTHQRMRLEGEICPEGHKIFPPRDLCPDCGKEAHDIYQFSGKGEVYTFTDDDQAIVKLEEGPMITAKLTDFTHHTEIRVIDGEEREVQVTDARIGTPVEMVTRRYTKAEDDEKNLLVYGYKFRPLIETS